MAHHWWRLPWVPSCAALAPSITIITAQIITAQRCSLSTQGRHLTPVLQFGISVTPSASKLPGSYQHLKLPQNSDTQVLLSPHTTLVAPMVQSFAKAIGGFVCLGVAECIQKYHKHRHFQPALRHQEENKVSKQFHCTLNYIKGKLPSLLSRKVRFSLVAGSGCFSLKGRGSRLKLPLGSNIKIISKNE